MKLAPDDPGIGAAARGMMERQMGHMVRLIDDLLDISRINQNKMELRRARILLNDIISNAVETARPLIDAAEHALTVSVPAEPVYLDADLTRLAQVFGNLLTNSAKYTEHGGHIWITSEVRGDNVVTWVRDTGIGIAREALPHIFDMFSQVDRRSEKSSGGLGIGLALVRGLVEMHDGMVTVSSDGEGKGTTFTVTLPREANASVVAGAPIDRDPAPATARRRILVADDNKDSANSMAMVLRLLGHDVDTANDGVAAVEAAEALRPDVIFMDLGMPRLNGYAATQLIRAEPWGQHMLIVALTGWGQDSDREQSRLAGCDGHLVKPASARELQRTLVELDAQRSA
jgi:CheY-like chemotaxis protein